MSEPRGDAELEGDTPPTAADPVVPAAVPMTAPASGSEPSVVPTAVPASEPASAPAPPVVPTVAPASEPPVVPTDAPASEPRPPVVPTAASVPAAAPLAQASSEPPNPSVIPVEAESVLPGRHRGGFQRLPTAPVDITTQSAPPDPDGEYDGPPVQWILPPPPQPARGLAGWALAFAILALVASLFVGWGFPLGIVAIVAAILALRRPIESRPVAVWAIVLGALSILYSAGWLFFAATSAGLIG